MTTTAPYGSWESPISVSTLTESAVRLGEIAADGGDVYWTEGRASEGGRTAIVKREAHGATADVTPADFNARTRVHEYGGGSWSVSDGVLVASKFEDQRVYRIADGEAVPITPEPVIPAGDRYADFALFGDRVICVRERHSEGEEAVNSLVTFPVDGSDDPIMIADGYDFYSTPRVSPDGQRLVWLVWNHPNMPWDGTELWTAALAADGTISEPEMLAGGVDESIYQPEWSPQGVLHFVSDRSGWWNIYRCDAGAVTACHTMEAEFGTPQWVFGTKRYGFLADGRIVSVFSEDGMDQIGIIGDDAMEIVSTPFTMIRSWLDTCGDTVYAVAGNSSEAPAVVTVDLDTRAVGILRTSLDLEIDPHSISHPKPIEFATSGDAISHAFYYPPHNPAFEPTEGEVPPLLVLSHGGPTSATTSELNLAIQFWTSRGFAVVDVNYRGSTGYGRAYRNALRGEWGVADLDDCINAALYLVDEGLADENRLAIRGGSAGGYTTLCALTFTDVFSAGASYYGVGDLAALATETHKFESRYLDNLIGPYPEAEDVYELRSPIHHLEELSCPVILLQGLDDRVVPPAQAEAVVAALDARGISHAYLAYEGEGHGFRKAENIERSYEAELYFYSRVFGFEPADALDPVPITHEDAL